MNKIQLFENQKIRSVWDEEAKEWINTRLQSIQFRKELTDQWKKAGIKEGLEYAILTNLMTKEWSGKTIYPIEWITKCSLKMMINRY